MPETIAMRSFLLFKDHFDKYRFLYKLVYSNFFVESLNQSPFMRCKTFPSGGKKSSKEGGRLSHRMTRVFFVCVGKKKKEAVNNCSNYAPTTT